MSDLSELYQEVILDHNKRPRNYRVLEAPSHTAEGYNPLCGDRLSLFLRVEGDVIADVGFQGSGCAISKASASLMTDALKGQATTLVAVLFLGGVQLIFLGIIGEYLGRIYDEVKRRPLYIVAEALGFEDEDQR